MPAGSQDLVRTLSWNIFHGLDEPPDSSLVTWRSRLLRVTETNATHAHVNRPLLDEYTRLLADYEWDVALLQEAPPRWLSALARGAGASGAASALTARNWGAPLRAWVADRNPGIMVSREGGSNQLLVRAPWRIAETRRLTLTRRPERRRMLWARLRRAGGAAVTVANMHLTARDSPKAGREAIFAAEHAVQWSGEDPLIFGGDLNAADTVDELCERYEFEPLPSEQPIEHLLGRRLGVVVMPRALPPEARELPGPEGRRLRLSDHPPLLACFGLPAAPAPQPCSQRRSETT
jgi:endonuclease/exonuclease/phosphatase family metal-dependent hydrolase